MSCSQTLPRSSSPPSPAPAACAYACAYAWAGNDSVCLRVARAWAGNDNQLLKKIFLGHRVDSS